MKPLPESDFRAKRLMLEDDDFALVPGAYEGRTDLVAESTWNSTVSLPDDVSVRTSDKYGTRLEQMWEYWGIWNRVVLAVQALSKDPSESPMAIAACDADEFQAATYCALVGHYRVGFSCLRNVLEQMMIGTRLALIPDSKYFTDWRNGSEKVGFGWAADTLPKSANVVALEKTSPGQDSRLAFPQKPKGFARRVFVELSKYTHGSAGFTDADSRQSNGPVFVAKTFLAWCVAALKTYALALHALKLAHPKLRKLPYGPPKMTFDQFRHNIVDNIPANDKGHAFFESLENFWP
jgi:hypothetical protein